MENSTKNIELIDRFIVNERKSKLWTIINFGIFCMLGLSIFFLAYELNQSNAKYKVINDQLEKTQDTLAMALAQLDNYNGSLKQDSISLTKRVGNYDSLKNVLDTVLMLLRASNTGVLDNSKIQAEAKIDEIIQKVYDKKNLTVSANIKNMIFDKRPQPLGGEALYTVYMQCMPGYEKLMPPLVKDLKEKKYKVPKWEVVKGVTFNPVIKYFYDADEDKARKLASYINNSDDFFHENPLQVQKLNLKSPLHQMEIWVGEYRQKDLKQLIQQSEANRKKY